MFKNYIKIAFRNLVKNKTSAFINISGLTIGIAVALLIGLWIYDELSFNTYHQHYDRMGRIVISGNDASYGPFVSSSLPYPLATELLQNYRDNFTSLVRASGEQEYILSAEDKNLSNTGQFMDEGAPEMFSLKMTRGSRGGLKDLHSIMLCASSAKLLFGDADPINRTVLINNKTSVKVTGVYEDLPLNSEFKNIKFFSTWDLWVSENDWILKTAINDWNNHFLHLYGEVAAGTNFNAVNQKIANAEILKIKGIDRYKDDVARNPQIVMDQMSNWHLHGIDRRGKPETGPLHMVWVMGIIGMFVLLLACINFMNLSTARSEKRGREVGIRKAIGSMRAQLIIQFFSESLVIVIFSFALACALATLSLPWFNGLANKSMVMPWTDPSFLLLCLGFIFFTALLAGSYPALYLSSFNPVKVLKGTFRVGRLASIPRKALVVMQFSVSIALIIGTIVVFRQLQFAKNRPVGYTRDGLIMAEMKSEDFYKKYDLLKTEFLNTGVVSEFSASMGKVTEVASGNNGFAWKGKNASKDANFGTLAITPEYGKTVGWQFIAGRDFSRDRSTDSSGMVINESAAKFMDLQNPVGEDVSWTWKDSHDIIHYKIIGVIKDMVMESPYEPVTPTMFFLKGHNGQVNWINIRVKPNVSMSKALATMETAFKKLVPTAPFDYKFADEEYAAKFAAEARISKLAGFSAALAIFISCMGLFGVASFTAEQRTKEIGVRKVLGASLVGLWGLLSKEFVQLIIVSLLIAAPVTYYFMHQWLQNYQYRTTLSWWIFAFSGGGALLITLITVSFQSVKAAMANPVKSLKTE